MGYTTLPQKYWKYTKINAWEDQEVWTLVGQATTLLDLIGILLIGDGYFYIGTVVIITVFPWQFLVITQIYRYNTEYWVVLLQKPQKQPLDVFCKRTCSQNFACNFVKKRLQHRCFLVKLAKLLRTSIFKNICERLPLQDITDKNYSSISFTKLLGLYNYYHNLWDLKISFVLLCSYSFW